MDERYTNYFERIDERVSAKSVYAVRDKQVKS
jgi:hypothetical protein